jgi:hypothetical protein
MNSTQINEVKAKWFGFDIGYNAQPVDASSNPL